MKALKWILGTLGVLIVLAVVAALFLMNKGAGRFDQTWDTPVEMVSISSDSASLALGRFIAESHGCQGCHGGNFAGQVMIDAPPFLAVASNLTSGAGGVGSRYSDEDWVRSIRHGVNPSGRGLMVMPSEAYHFLNDEEMGALVAYLKTLDPVDNELPPFEMRPLGKLIMGVDPAMSTAPGMMPDRERVTGVERGVTADWGHYRASVVCMVCHGGNLQGGQPPDPDSPLAPDLRVVAGWGQDAFLEFFRTGVNPSGREINKEVMPWDKFSHLGEDELTAIYLYLETIN
ncbi:MAG: c-type cytochrome [Bacteroidetes bacterium]|nr:c-type cytochrome [Bacteroidota bacterium]